jgi:hypothetical protein
MPNTSKFALPYPALSDAPNGPLAIQNLANGVDALGILGGKRRTGISSAVNTIESIVVDTQTLSLAANSVFLIDFYCAFTVTVAATDVTMRVRLTSVSGTIVGEAAAFGVYVSPQPNHGHVSLLYKTTAAELDYFAGSIVRIAGTGNANAIVPTSLTVTNLGGSTIIGDF